MKHNLIPPFIMGEAGLLVNKVPTIHVKDPEYSDHLIMFPDDDLKIHLTLLGTFPIQEN